MISAWPELFEKNAPLQKINTFKYLYRFLEIKSQCIFVELECCDALLFVPSKNANTL